MQASLKSSPPKNNVLLIFSLALYSMFDLPELPVEVAWPAPYTLYPLYPLKPHRRFPTRHRFHLLQALDHRSQMTKTTPLVPFRVQNHKNNPPLLVLVKIQQLLEWWKAESVQAMVQRISRFSLCSRENLAYMYSVGLHTQQEATGRLQE